MMGEVERRCQTDYKKNNNMEGKREDVRRPPEKKIKNIGPILDDALRYFLNICTGYIPMNTVLGRYIILVILQFQFI
jgi:hypothetical protein